MPRALWTYIPPMDLYSIWFLFLLTCTCLIFWFLSINATAVKWKEKHRGVCVSHGPAVSCNFYEKDHSDLCLHCLSAQVNSIILYLHSVFVWLLISNAQEDKSKCIIFHLCKHVQYILRGVSVYFDTGSTVCTTSIDLIVTGSSVPALHSDCSRRLLVRFVSSLYHCFTGHWVSGDHRSTITKCVILSQANLI